GSGRSVGAFDLHAALTDCGGLLTEFGGHAYAAGFSIETGNIVRFREAFGRIAADRLAPADLQPTLEVDGALPPHEVTRDLIDELAQLEPWGHANEEPMLIAIGVEVRDVRRIGRKQQHLKLQLAEPGRESADAVMWNAGAHADTLAPGQKLDVCYRPQVNAYNGRETVQLRIEDVRPSGSGDAPAC
ncbi:MAG: single-stranded-DNA-specific exonuclease RecJ, partial [Armatimonadetes bacterium]|nr:single-stranded-DNA-specific exonuclease RecJ [Armatimonadota bacterium]